MVNSSNSPYQHFNILDTEYADIIANSSDPQFELSLVNLGVDIKEARTKVRLLTLLKKQPQNSEEWEALLNAWEDACGDRPSNEILAIVSKLMWEKA